MRFSLINTFESKGSLGEFGGSELAHELVAHRDDDNLRIRRSLAARIEAQRDRTGTYAHEKQNMNVRKINS